MFSKENTNYGLVLCSVQLSISVLWSWIMTNTKLLKCCFFQGRSIPRQTSDGVMGYLILILYLWRYWQCSYVVLSVWVWFTQSAKENSIVTICRLLSVSVSSTVVSLLWTIAHHAARSCHTYQISIPTTLICMNHGDQRFFPALNLFKSEFNIVIFIHYKLRIAVTIHDL